VKKRPAQRAAAKCESGSNCNISGWLSNFHQDAIVSRFSQIS
jgi:hypothetical protein